MNKCWFNGAQTLQKDLVLNEQRLTSVNCSQRLTKEITDGNHLLDAKFQSILTFLQLLHRSVSTKWLRQKLQNLSFRKEIRKKSPLQKYFTSLYLFQIAIVVTLCPIQSPEILFWKNYHQQLKSFIYLNFFLPILILCTSFEFSVSKVQVLMVPKTMISF